MFNSLFDIPNRNSGSARLREIKKNTDMPWDQTILKKFNSTSHYRLLNQLRNEIKPNRISKKDKINENETTDNNYQIND